MNENLTRRTSQTYNGNKRGPHGYDGGKRVNGRKRHLIVDTQGLMLGCLVTPANVGDREGAKMLMRLLWLKYPNLHVFADGGYDGSLVEWAKNCYGYTLEIVVKPKEKKGFSVLPRRWVVERSFTWAARFRRLARDYERLLETLAGLHYVVFAVLMLGKAATLLQSA